MAFVYDYGKGRVFQTVLGHAAESIRVAPTAALVCRGAAWAARRRKHRWRRGRGSRKLPRPNLAPEGRFGAALDPRAAAATAERREIYDRLPISVECWAKVNSKSGFNVLVANNSKDSAEHWEIYTYTGSGEFSLYLPGFEPAEIRSDVDIADGQWHYVAAAFDSDQANLYVDGKLVKKSGLKRTRSGGVTAPLFFGGYPPQTIGCDGLIDEVRISNALRPFAVVPPAPLDVDEQTIGLWHFDRIEDGQAQDVSREKNAAVTTGNSSAAVPGPLLTRWTADPNLKTLTIDSSPDESFFSLRLDTSGRIFVGGREALFVYEPDDGGGYKPRKLLYRFPPDSWITDCWCAATICM